ncbi:MAG: B12-binding domain-containing protein [Anaerolineales bacterium]|nr:B12-binding domain-containing protein [Anaerolineales bacterium]
MSENTHLQAISAAVIDGELEDAVNATQAALDSNIDPLEILNQGLMDGADEVGNVLSVLNIFYPN